MHDLKDRLFSQLVLEAGLISKQHLAECEEEQKRILEHRTTAPPIHEVLHQKGILTHTQFEHILQNRNKRDSRRFGEIAIALGFVEEAQLNHALDVQAALQTDIATRKIPSLEETSSSPYANLLARAITFGEVPKIGEILIALEYMKPHQATIILREQQRAVATCKLCNALLIVPNYTIGNRKTRCNQCGTALIVISSDHSSPPTPIETLIDEDLDPLISKVIEGLRLGDFDILEIIGVDSSGVVCKARRISDDLPVCIKVLNMNSMADETFRQRFLEDSIKVSRFEHSGIQKVFTAGKYKDYYYAVAEFVEADTARSKEKYPIADALGIGIQVADALAYAHSQNVIHGGIKPSNILLLPDGSVKITNLGFAQNRQKDLSLVVKSGRIPPYFVAPEQVLDTICVDLRSDVFLLSATLYYLMTGRPPYDGNSPFEVMISIVKKPPTPITNLVPETPPEIWKVIEKALDPDPDQRYQNMELFAKDLKKVLADIEPTGVRMEHIEGRKAHRAFAVFEREAVKTTNFRERAPKAEALSAFVKELRMLDRADIHGEIPAKTSKEPAARQAAVSSPSKANAQLAASLPGAQKRQSAPPAAPRTRWYALACAILVIVITAVFFTFWNPGRRIHVPHQPHHVPHTTNENLVFYKGQLITPEQHKKLLEQEIRDFEKSQMERGLVKFRGLWVTPDEKKKLEQHAREVEKSARDGKIEWKGRRFTPRELESQIFKDRMSRQGYVWKDDRWIPKELADSPVPQLPPPPEHTAPSEDVPAIKIDTPILQIVETRHIIKPEASTIVIRGTSNLPPKMVLIGNLRYPLRPNDSILSNMSHTSDDGSFEIALTFEKNRKINPLLYTVDVLFNPAYQKCRIELQDGTPPEQTSISTQLLMGDIKRIDKRLSEDTQFIEKLISECRRGFDSLTDAFNKCTATSPPSTRIFSSWQHSWTPRLESMLKMLDDYDSDYLVPYFPSTSAMLRTCLNKILELSKKYKYILSNIRTGHTYEDKYVSQPVISDFLSRVEETFEEEKETLNDIITSFRTDKKED